MREKKLKIIALGPDRSAVLDALGQVQIFNALQTHMTFVGVTFKNGHGSSGGAVYGERSMTFENCNFEENFASVHGGAVMGGRGMTFKRCEFHQNEAKFAGAVRVNDIGSAVLEDCLFTGNRADGRGGALVTQIEDPKNTVGSALTFVSGIDARWKAGAEGCGWLSACLRGHDCQPQLRSLIIWGVEQLCRTENDH